MATSLTAFLPTGAPVGRAYWFGAMRRERGRRETIDLHLLPLAGAPSDDDVAAAERPPRDAPVPFPDFANLAPHLAFAGHTRVALPVGLLPRVRLGRALRTGREPQGWRAPLRPPICHVGVERGA